MYRSDGKQKSSRKPVFPVSWKDQFGIPFEEHQKALQVNMFDGYALFSLSDKENSEEGTISDKTDLDKNDKGGDLDERSGLP